MRSQWGGRGESRAGGRAHRVHDGVLAVRAGKAGCRGVLSGRAPGACPRGGLARRAVGACPRGVPPGRAPGAGWQGVLAGRAPPGAGWPCGLLAVRPLHLVCYGPRGPAPSRRGRSGRCAPNRPGMRPNPPTPCAGQRWSARGSTPARSPCAWAQPSRPSAPPWSPFPAPLAEGAPAAAARVGSPTGRRGRRQACAGCPAWRSAASPGGFSRRSPHACCGDDPSARRWRARSATCQSRPAARSPLMARSPAGTLRHPAARRPTRREANAAAGSGASAAAGQQAE